MALELGEGQRRRDLRCLLEEVCSAVGDSWGGAGAEGKRSWGQSCHFCAKLPSAPAAGRTMDGAGHPLRPHVKARHTRSHSAGQADVS